MQPTIFGKNSRIRANRDGCPLDKTGYLRYNYVINHLKLTMKINQIMMKNETILNEMTAPLLYWYQGAARDLPWRRDVTPYHVWISEIMLQQTRVEAVKGYYARFLEAFPTVEALAAAEDDVLNKVWQGLGYYSRARNLKKAAIRLVEDYNGVLPADYEALLSLPGIGAYTAGAIGSIAFGLPTPAVDGNVLRVVTRLCADDADIMKQTTKDSVTAALAEIYPETPDEAAMMTQALMELGATVCVPNGAPHCEECPLASLCQAHADGEELLYPNKPPKKGRTRVDKTVFLLRCGNRYAIRKRPDEGLLSGLWEFPSVDAVLDEQEAVSCLRRGGLAVEAVERIPDAKHIFTHIEWHMRGYLVSVRNEHPSYVWADAEEIRQIYSIPSAFKAFLGLLHANGQEVSTDACAAKNE